MYDLNKEAGEAEFMDRDEVVDSDLELGYCVIGKQNSKSFRISTWKGSVFRQMRNFR